jgi:hypothetical protein
LGGSELKDYRDTFTFTFYSLKKQMLYCHSFQPATECAIRKVQENQVCLNLNGTHQHLAYTDGINTLSENTNSKQKITEVLLEARRQVGLEVNTDVADYMVMSRHQTAG